MLFIFINFTFKVNKQLKSFSFLKKNSNGFDVNLMKLNISIAVKKKEKS